MLRRAAVAQRQIRHSSAASYGSASSEGQNSAAAASASDASTPELL
jgi:hypothetical protein